MIVHIPSPLRSYTDEEASIEGKGKTIDEMLRNLDRRFPGFRFRVIDEQDGIREHIRFFKETQPLFSIDDSIEGAREVHIICAISGG